MGTGWATDGIDLGPERAAMVVAPLAPHAATSTVAAARLAPATVRRIDLTFGIFHASLARNGLSVPKIAGYSD